jgi:hypothetical protein
VDETMLIPWADAIIRTYQGRGLALRARYEVRRRLGVYERHRSRTVPETRLSIPALALEAIRGFFAQHPDAREQAIHLGTVTAAGCLQVFGRSRAFRFPPEWHRHPITDEVMSREHWSRQSDAGDQGDIKWLWEPARFGAAMALSRAFVASGDARHADAFQELFLDFLEKNPAYFGVHWVSGQECALRVISVLFAASVFQSGGVAMPCDALKQFLYDSGRRIASSLDYALSQRNNHALAELTGLWLCAQALRDVPERGRWQKLVFSRLPRVLADQFAADGSYIQESLSYHRLALQLLLVLAWAEMPEPEIVRAIERSSAYLAHFVDDASGQVPNLGANDSGTVFSLSSCAHGDYRPTLQHAHARATGRRFYGMGPWDEEAAWFSQALYQTSRAPERPPMALFPSGNLCSFRGTSRLYLRAPEHGDHRPGQADSLHLDLWRGSKNLALDPGTYLYSGAPPWRNVLAETRYHNTCSVGADSQMRRHGRFFWTRWSRAELLGALSQGDATLYHVRTWADANHTIDHERFVIHTASGALVLDRLRGAEPACLRLHWNLAPDFAPLAERVLWDGATRVLLSSDPDLVPALFRGEADRPLGWHSPSYGQKEPCLAVELETTAASAHFFTWFAWAEDKLLDRMTKTLWADWHAGATGQALTARLSTAR